jgi:transposase
MRPYGPAIEHLDTVLRINQRVAEVIIAETGGDMSRFPTPPTCPPGPGCAPATISWGTSPLINRQAKVCPHW